jgi:ATP-binding cassette subfamily G (WHITE) protein 2 (SNQ2)
MANEFRTFNPVCSNLVPQGPGYENITLENQVCAVVGAIPGETTVSGLRYLKFSFNYEQSHMWRVRKRYAPVTPPMPSFLHSSA